MAFRGRRQYRKRNMVRKVKRNFVRRRRNFAKRRVAGRAMVRTPGGFPDRYFTKFIVYNNFTIGDTGNPYVRQSINVYDPTETFPGFTDNPSGWVTLKEVYDNYLVLGAAIKVIASNATTTPVTVTVFTDNTETTTTDLSAYTDWMEYPYAKQVVLAGNTGGTCVKSINHNITTRKVFGLTRLSPQDSEFTGYCGSTNSNNAYQIPSINWRYILGVATLTGSNLAASAVTGTIKVTIYMCLFNRLRGY